MTIISNIIGTVEVENLTDEQIEALYDNRRAGAAGEAVGKESDSPLHAAKREGWTVLRKWDSKNVKGMNVLADDGIGRIWAIVDDNGPWGIIIAEE